MKAKVFYHGSDMDGYASGYIAKQYCKEMYPDAEISMIPLIYGYRELSIDDFKDMNNQDDVAFIADWSLAYTQKNEELLDWILMNFMNVVWCDHHDTSLELCKNYGGPIEKLAGVRSLEHSGAYLLYHYLYPKNEIPYWLNLVSDYDTFKIRYEESIAFNYGILNCGKHDPSFETSIWDSITSSDKGRAEYALSKTIRHGRQIFKYILADNKRYLMSNGFECYLEGYKCLACNRISNSFLFNSIDKSKYDLLCSFVFDGSQYRYSIYSDDSINCADIAARYGGGGHKGAAGFRANKMLFTKMHKLDRTTVR